MDSNQKTMYQSGIKFSYQNQNLNNFFLCRPHGLYPTRLLCPWDSPGKNTGVGCQFLLQGIFLTQGLNSHLLHWRQVLYHLTHQGMSIYSYPEKQLSSPQSSANREIGILPAVKTSRQIELRGTWELSWKAGSPLCYCLVFGWPRGGKNSSVFCNPVCLSWVSGPKWRALE